VDSPAAQTRELARSFGDTVAVRSLDLDIRRGELYGLVGPDGAGKSTAIRLLCGILHPTGGEGRVLGMDLVKDTEAIKARIGYLSQNFTLYGDLTVDENIEFFADLHGVGNLKARRDELLEFTRLSPFHNRLAQALSGGMKKKLALACTLIHTPDVIFLDEPSTGVDPVSRGEFWHILSGILEKGVTIIMTTPYLDEADRCHHVGLMHRGRIIRHGTPDELRAGLPGRIYRIECGSPAIAGKALRKGLPGTRLVLYGDRIHAWIREDTQGIEPVTAWLNSNGFGPASSSATDPTLEDVFVALMEMEART